MKKIFSIVILMFSLQFVYGQACGIYRIKYEGKIVSGNIEVHSIKLPTIPFLHNLEKSNSKFAYVEMPLQNDKIVLETSSHLTSNLFNNPEHYLKFYKNKKDKLPFIVVMIIDGKKQEKLIEIEWQKIQIKKIRDNGFGNLFKIDLGKIKI